MAVWKAHLLDPGASQQSHTSPTWSPGLCVHPQTTVLQWACLTIKLPGKVSLTNCFCDGEATWAEGEPRTHTQLPGPNTQCQAPGQQDGTGSPRAGFLELPLAGPCCTGVSHGHRHPGGPQLPVLLSTPLGSKAGKVPETSMSPKGGASWVGNISPMAKAGE